MMRSLLTVFLSFFAVAVASAAPVAAPIQGEIDALMSRLQGSGCEFNRNGAWYTGAEAKKHLLQKLGYVSDKTTLKNTEQFIELAASTSSSSGKPYLVRCADTAPIESRTWLRQQLTAIRSAGQPAASSPQ